MAGLIKMTFLGDLMCQMEQVRSLRRSRVSYDVVFSDVRHLWRESDYVVSNLETPVTGGGWRLVFEDMRFNAPVPFLQAIKNAKIDLVTTANNHILDRNYRGLDATLREIGACGLQTTGAYCTREDADQIIVKEISGVKFAFLACTYDTNAGRKSDVLPRDLLWKVDYVHRPTPYQGSFSFAFKRLLKGLIPYRLRMSLKRQVRGRNLWSNPQSDSFPVEDFDKEENRLLLTRFCEKIRRAHTVADVVIVLPHIGGQYNGEPGPWQLKVTDALIDAGADLVVANHAHTPLRAETRKGVFCVHALGNLCFTPRVGFYNDKCQADYSIVLNCFFDRDTKKLQRKTFSLAKSVVRADGVSVVRPICAEDVEDVDVICRRVTGKNEHFDVLEEYEL